MQIFITGASSYIGKYLILYFLQMGYKVLSTSRTSPKIYKKDHRWIKHDLSKKKIDLNSYRPDIVIHLAGLAWMNRPSEDYINSNILTTNNLVKSLKNKKIKNFFYFSSRDIYGDFKGSVLKENSTINDPSIYGYSKLIAEKLLSNNFPVTILRLPSIIGLGTHGWINSIVEKLKNNKKITLSSHKFNNFMHASELSKIVLKLAKSKIKSDTFLVSCSNIIRSSEVVKLLKSNLHSKSLIKINKDQKPNYIISSKKLNKYYKTIKVEEVINKFSNELKFNKKHFI